MTTTTRPTRATPGTVTHDNRPMTYAHGQRAAYVLDRCRCEPCRTANRAASQADRDRLAPATVDATPARAHLAMLAAAGVGLKTVAKRSGVSHGALSKLVHGTAGRAPSKRIRPDTEARILAIHPNAAADGARVPAAPIWTLIDEMVTAGVPRRRIAEHIGQTGAGLQLGRDMVSAAHARTIRALHADWTAGRVQLARHSRHGAPRPVAAPTSEPDYIDRAAILLDLAELLEAANDQPWRRDAACRGRDPHIWHPATTDTRMITAAKRICAACLVRSQCLAAHLDQRDGIFGGLTPAERRDRRRMEVRAG